MGSQAWTELPESTREAVQRQCGRVVKVELPTAGRCSDFTATLRTDTGPVFCKGSRVDARMAWMPRNEATVAPYLPACAPRLLWQIEDAGWHLLGFEHIAGRHADLSPGSPDLTLIAAAVAEANAALTPCPPVGVGAVTRQWSQVSPWRRLRRDTPAGLDPWSRANLDRFVDIGDRAAELVAGDSLVHTDLHGLNILISDHRARLIDWAWARRGAPWVDTGYLIVRLIAAGHTPAAAEEWATAIPAWRATPESARFAFAVGVLGLWEHLQHTDPLPHRAKLTDAARSWAQWRDSCLEPASP